MSGLMLTLCAGAVLTGTPARAPSPAPIPVPAPMRPSAPSLATGPTRNAAALMARVGFDQNLDAQVPLDIPLRDEAGRPLVLGDLLGKKPVILNLVYYECPMLCNEVLNSLLRSLNALSFEVGKEFDVVTVSIDPTEDPPLAARKKARYLARYGTQGALGYQRKASAERGWHFLTAGEPAIQRLAGAVGFRYVYDPESKQYAHAAGIVVLTPEGKISRYYYGLSYPARDLRLGLSEASAGKIGTPIDRMLLMCYHYDPKTGKYNFAAMSAIRLLGTLTMLGLGSYLFVMFRRDFRGGGPNARSRPPAPSLGE